MKLRHLILLLLLNAMLWPTAWAGMRVEISDPRYFEREHEVIFPHAEVKLVAFEFASSEGDERGKLRAKELHDQFLRKIHDLHGGAIITYVTPPGQRIDNYRVQAAKVAKDQQAQMVLWGRIYSGKENTAYINARLELIQPPPGISAELRDWVRPHGETMPFELQGVVNAPVTTQRVDFNAYENDVTPLAYFLSGLARYYKGAVRERADATRWLGGAIDDLRHYIGQVPETLDRASLAQAHLYLARAHVRLALIDTQQKKTNLALAAEHAAEAARLDPYAAEIPTTQAVIAILAGKAVEETQDFLHKAVRLAPTNGDVRMNLAVFETAQGKVKEGIKQLDSAEQVQMLLKQQTDSDAKSMRMELEQIQRIRP